MTAPGAGTGDVGGATQGDSMQPWPQACRSRRLRALSEDQECDLGGGVRIQRVVQAAAGRGPDHRRMTFDQTGERRFVTLGHPGGEIDGVSLVFEASKGAHVREWPVAQKPNFFPGRAGTVGADPRHARRDMLQVAAAGDVGWGCSSDLRFRGGDTHLGC